MFSKTTDIKLAEVMRSYSILQAPNAYREAALRFAKRAEAEERVSNKLGFEAWLDKYTDDLDCEAAESGLDREMDFSKERWLEAKYEEYVSTVSLTSTQCCHVCDTVHLTSTGNAIAHARGEGNKDE